MSEEKKMVYDACVEHLQQRIETVLQRLNAVEESRNNETKSSVGDKHETGRAMLQLEEEKTRAQLSELQKIKSILNRIDPLQTMKIANLNSLIKTNKGSYYIAIGIGKLHANGQVYFCVSPQSPIGKQLLQHQAGDRIVFNQNEIQILEIH